MSPKQFLGNIERKILQNGKKEGKNKGSNVIQGDSLNASQRFLKDECGAMTALDLDFLDSNDSILKQGKKSDVHVLTGQNILRDPLNVKPLGNKCFKASIYPVAGKNLQI